MRVLLPVKSQAFRPTEEKSVGVARPLRILFVDDEPLIRAAMADLLEEHGHIVQVAEDGHEGVASFHAALERAFFLDNTELPQEVDAVLSKPPRLSELQRVLARLIHVADQGPSAEPPQGEN